MSYPIKGHLTTDVKFSDVLDYASGTSDRTAEVDMTGYNGVCFVVKFAAVASSAVTSVTLQDHDVTSTGQTTNASFTTAVADDDDNQTIILDYKNPPKRFVTLLVDKDASNATAEVAVAILYNGENAPITNAEADEITVVAV